MVGCHIPAQPMPARRDRPRRAISIQCERRQGEVVVMVIARNGHRGQRAVRRRLYLIVDVDDPAERPARRDRHVLHIGCRLDRHYDRHRLRRRPLHRTFGVSRRQGECGTGRDCGDLKSSRFINRRRALNRPLRLHRLPVAVHVRCHARIDSRPSRRQFRRTAYGNRIKHRHFPAPTFVARAEAACVSALIVGGSPHKIPVTQPRFRLHIFVRRASLPVAHLERIRR